MPSWFSMILNSCKQERRVFQNQQSGAYESSTWPQPASWPLERTTSVVESTDSEVLGNRSEEPAAASFACCTADLSMSGPIGAFNFLGFRPHTHKH